MFSEIMSSQIMSSQIGSSPIGSCGKTPARNMSSRITPARLMIVDGDDVMLVLMSYNLVAAGHAVEALSCGAEAEARITKDRPDLLVLDWMLPGLSGLQLCRRLRRTWQPEQLPILIVGAQGGAADRDFALANGACEILAKPFSMQALQLTVLRLLARSHLQAAE